METERWTVRIVGKLMIIEEVEDVMEGKADGKTSSKKQDVTRRKMSVKNESDNQEDNRVRWEDSMKKKSVKNWRTGALREWVKTCGTLATRGMRTDTAARKKCDGQMEEVLKRRNDK